MVSPHGDDGTEQQSFAHNWEYYMNGAFGEELIQYSGFQTVKESDGDIGRRVYLSVNKFNATSDLHIRRDGIKEVYFTDNNGNVRVVIDSNNNINKYDYKPFGGLYWSSDGTHLREGLEGSIYDPESELQMMGFRMYDTETGRFTTPDLLWAAFPSHTPYHYAYNSPMIWSDPSGLAPEKERDREKLMGGEESGPIYSNPLMPKFQLELNAIHALQLKWMGQSNNDFIAKYQSDDKDAIRLAENNAIWTWATSLPATVNGEFKNVHNVNFIYSESKVRFTGDRYRGSEVLGYITGTKIEIDAQGHINFFTVTDASRSETLLWLHSIMKSGKRIDISFGNHGTNVFNYSNKNLPIVKIDESSLSNSQNKYWSISGNRIRFTIEQILAHEFLGHALDWVNGNHPDIGGFYSVVDLESWAIYVENVVIKYMGGEPRDCYNCWHHKTIFFRLFHKNPNWEIYKIK